MLYGGIVIAGLLALLLLAGLYRELRRLACQRLPRPIPSHWDGCRPASKMEPGAFPEPAAPRPLGRAFSAASFTRGQAPVTPRLRGPRRR